MKLNEIEWNWMKLNEIKWNLIIVADSAQAKTGMLSKISNALQSKFADSSATLKEKAMASCVGNSNFF